MPQVSTIIQSQSLHNDVLACRGTASRKSASNLVGSNKNAHSLLSHTTLVNLQATIDFSAAAGASANLLLGSLRSDVMGTPLLVLEPNSSPSFSERSSQDTNRLRGSNAGLILNLSASNLTCFSPRPQVSHIKAYSR